MNTLVYFNTKYFQLKTPDEHLKLSFSHIMKHWKKTTITKAGEQQRTVLLRYYPPPQKVSTYVYDICPTYILPKEKHNSMACRDIK